MKNLNIKVEGFTFQYGDFTIARGNYEGEVSPAAVLSAIQDGAQFLASLKTTIVGAEKLLADTPTRPSLPDLKDLRELTQEAVAAAMRGAAKAPAGRKTDPATT